MTDETSKAPVQVPNMCDKHQSLLVHQAGFTRLHPWRALIIAAQVSLFQAAMSRPTTHQRLGGDITNLSSLGCLACYQPDSFGQIVEAAKSEGLSAVKKLGERWVNQKNEEAKCEQGN